LGKGLGKPIGKCTRGVLDQLFLCFLQVFSLGGQLLVFSYESFDQLYPQLGFKQVKGLNLSFKKVTLLGLRLKCFLRRSKLQLSIDAVVFEFFLLSLGSFNGVFEICDLHTKSHDLPQEFGMGLPRFV